MSATPTRSQLKKDFFARKITLPEFKELMLTAMRYRGVYIIPGRKPQWSGPFRSTFEEADHDNAPYYDQGYAVDVYQEQQ